MRPTCKFVLYISFDREKQLVEIEAKGGHLEDDRCLTTYSDKKYLEYLKSFPIDIEIVNNYKVEVQNEKSKKSKNRTIRKVAATVTNLRQTTPFQF